MIEEHYCTAIVEDGCEGWIPEEEKELRNVCGKPAKFKICCPVCVGYLCNRHADHAMRNWDVKLKELK